MTAPAVQQPDDLLDEYRRSLKSSGGVPPAEGGDDLLDEYAASQPPRRMAPVVVNAPVMGRSPFAPAAPPAPAPLQMPPVVVRPPANVIGGRPAPSSRTAPPLPPADNTEPADFMTRLAEMVGEFGLHPEALVTAPLGAAATASRASAEAQAQSDIGMAGGEPSTLERTVSPVQARDAATQLGVTLGVGPAERALSGALVRTPLARWIGSRAAGMVAPTIAGAGTGAAFSPQDPALGAAAGGVLGGVTAGVHGTRLPTRQITYSGEAESPDVRPRIGQAPEQPARKPTVTGTAPFEPPAGPDFTVEDSPLLREYEASRTPRSVVNAGEAPGAEAPPARAPSAPKAPETNTPYDTPKVVAARQRAAEIPPTNTIETPERTQLRQQIAERMYGQGAPTKERQAYIVLGPPGAGKTSAVAGPLAQQTGSLVLDPDDAKKLLPEYEGGVGAGAVHVESGDIRAAVLQRAVASGDNLIIPTLGTRPAALHRTLDELQRAGYTTHVKLVEVPKDVAAQRAVKRFEEGGHFVEPAYIVHAAGESAKTYEALKQRPGIASYERYDNNVEHGQPPRLLERTEGLPRPAAPEAAVPAVPGAGTGPGSDRRGAGGRGQEGQRGPAEAGEGPAAEVAQEPKHKFSSTQLDLPPETASKITQLGRSIPALALAEDGRETEPHITVKYGLHGDDAEKVRALLVDEPPVTVALGKTSFFPNGESNAGDVVKVDVDSPALHRLNKKIADALPHTDTHPEYKPHATIAYVKPGLGKKYAGRKDLQGHTVTIDHVTFSDRNGQKTVIPLGGKATDLVDEYQKKKGVAGRIKPDIPSLLHNESESLESETEAAPGPTEEDEADRHPPTPQLVEDAPGKRDLFGNAVAPTVEQPSLLGEGAGTERSRRDAKQLARKDNAISPDEMAERRDELGAPKAAPARSPELDALLRERRRITLNIKSEGGAAIARKKVAAIDAQIEKLRTPAKARKASRKPVEHFANPKYRLDTTDDLYRRAAELEARLQSYASGEHGAPLFVRDAVDLTKPVSGYTAVQQRLVQDGRLYGEVLEELRARHAKEGLASEDAEEAIDEGIAKHAQGPVTAADAEFNPDDFMSKQRTGEGTVGAGFDRSLFKKLGANLYKGDIASVAVKEGLQNAVDALRGLGGEGAAGAAQIPHGRVHIHIDEAARVIRVTDNGVGMTPEVAANQFMDIGGSQKSEGSSGGFGLAKVGLLASAEHFRLETTAETGAGEYGLAKKTRTVIEGSGEDWANGTLTIRSATAAHDTPTGTDLEIRFEGSAPFSAYDAINYVKKAAHFSRLPFAIDATARRKGKDTSAPLVPIPADERQWGYAAINPEPVKRLSVNGASADVYESAEGKPTYGQADVHILNNGLYQFAMAMQVGENGPKTLVIDVHPTASIDESDYPFTTNREQLKGPIEERLREFGKEIQTLAGRREVETLVHTLRTAPTIEGQDHHRVIDTTGQVPNTVLGTLARRPYARRLADLSEHAMNAIVTEVRKVRARIEQPYFGGLSAAGGYLGVNLYAPAIRKLVTSTGAEGTAGAPGTPLDLGGNLIYYNPWATYREAPPFDYARDLAQWFSNQWWGTMAHEVAHQLEHGHEVAFAGVLTRVMGALGRIQGAWLEEADHLFHSLLAGDDFLRDYTELKSYWTKGNDLFKKFSDEQGRPETPARARRVGGDAARGDAVAEQPGTSPVRRPGSALVEDARGDAVRGGEEPGGPERRPATDLRGAGGGAGGERVAPPEKERAPADPEATPIGGLVDIHSFTDPFTAALAMLRAARKLHAQRMKQQAASAPKKKRLTKRQRQALLQTGPTAGPHLDALRRLLSPGTRSAGAGRFQRMKAHELAKMAQENERAIEWLEAKRDLLDQLPAHSQKGVKDFKGPRWQWAFDMEAGKLATKDPKLALLGLTTGRLLDDYRTRVQDLGTGKLEHFIENYMPHAWTNPKAAVSWIKQVLGKRPAEGPKSFLKRRSIDTLEEGIDQGLEPISDNPLDLLLLKLREINRYLAWQHLFQQGRKEGIFKFYRGAKKPDGWQWIEDNMAVVYAPRGDEGELRIRGRCAAPEPVATLVHNYLRPGLRGNPLYDSYMRVGNILNLMQLGWSGFHAGFVAFDATISTGAVGIQEMLTKGQRLRGLKHAGIAAASAALGPVTVLPLLAPALSLAKGSQVRRAYLEGTTDPQLEAIVQGLVAGGGRVRMDSFYKAGFAHAFRKALRDKRWVAAGLDLPFAATELAMKPLLEHIVPRMKLGAFATLWEHELRKLPAGATTDDVEKAAKRVWDSIDNRLGQMTYENLDWNRFTKDVLMAGIRSVGWNVGDVRELGGAGLDVARTPQRVKEGQSFMTPRIAYAVALATLVAVYGAIYTYLHTGDLPGQEDGEDKGTGYLLKDLYYPRTGERNHEGQPERVTPATYVKDVVGASRHFLTTVAHKTNPLLTELYNLVWSNENFFGDQIRNTEDPWYRQARDVAKEVLGVAEPFTVRNLGEQRRRGAGPLSQAEGFFGVTAAPREIVRSPAENLMQEYIRARMPAGGSTPEEREAAQARAELAGEIREGKLTRQDAIARGREQGIITTSQQAHSVAHRGKEDPFVSKFKALTAEEAERVYQAATPEQREKYRLRAYLRLKQARAGIRAQAGGLP